MPLPLRVPSRNRALRSLGRRQRGRCELLPELGAVSVVPVVLHVLRACQDLAVCCLDCNPTVASLALIVAKLDAVALVVECRDKLVDAAGVVVPATSVHVRSVRDGERGHALLAGVERVVAVCGCVRAHVACV